MIKKFLTESKDIERDSYIWNTIGSILFSCQPVILLAVLTRTVSLSDSGIFTFAFANATMFSYIGKYGMRTFMVSDAREQFSFEEYCSSRVITMVLTLGSCLIYDIYASISNHYEFTK